MDATKKLIQEMALAVIERLAASEKPLDLYLTFKSVAKGKILHESRGYFWRQVQKKVFRSLKTSENGWRNWSAKARLYMEARATQQEPGSEIIPSVLAMPIEQVPLF